MAERHEANGGTIAQIRKGFDRWKLMSLYQQFEQIIILILTVLIAVIVVLAVWNLIVRLVLSIILSQNSDPAEYGVFQTLFGMIFTVIIALEFKRSILVVAERRQNIVQVRAVILLALLAVVRKLIILDLKETDALQLMGLSTAILALGAVYWLVRYQDSSESGSKASIEGG